MGDDWGAAYSSQVATERNELGLAPKDETPPPVPASSLQQQMQSIQINNNKSNEPVTTFGQGSSMRPQPQSSFGMTQNAHQQSAFGAGFRPPDGARFPANPNPNAFARSAQPAGFLPPAAGPNRGGHFGRGSPAQRGRGYSGGPMNGNGFIPPQQQQQQMGYPMGPAPPQFSQTHFSAPKPPKKIDENDLPMSPEEIALLNKFLHNTVNLMKDEQIDVRLRQNDPQSPLHSATSFRDLRLKSEILHALDVMGFVRPSKIQEFALPILLMEPPTNMIAQSQSGTGKTASFALAMLSRAVPSSHFPQCICLAPTYELAVQIGEVVRKMAQFLPEVKVHYAVKNNGVRAGTKLEEQIIIGTPGRMNDYLGKLQLIDPSKITVLVLDEADVMIRQQGHQDLSMRIYNAIETASPGVQTLLFSATYDQPVIEFAEKLIKNAVSVTLKREDQALPNIKQYFVECISRDGKYQAVVNLYSGLTMTSSVIFTHTKHSAMWLADQIKMRGYKVALLHGEMPIPERAQAIQDFKNGVYKVLITTNVCSRGIDVSQVTIVINYDPPVNESNSDEPDYDTYLHRIGRTGRFGKAGIAINFVDDERSLQLIKKIEAHFGKPIPKLDPDDMNALEAINED
ncbi:hypothetical protein WR25_26685 [Diploscapter pachys]|uniref:RNA helicase n=1 Tax=Diploscapter pachys TaxID=2018661 RepID=A0A2A2L921_9BILA|nr:hypothetical protein WR25_26685 [Diploscapter pachys]